MKKAFLDTNVVLDLLGERKPFYLPAAKIATLADKGTIEIVVSTLTYSTVFYLLSKFENNNIVKEKISKFKAIAITSDLTNQIIDKGLVSNFSDFEDALQYHCALHENCQILITRNSKDFKQAQIPVMSPDEFLNSLK